jgi:hypothetical protein
VDQTTTDYLEQYEKKKKAFLETDTEEKRIRFFDSILSFLFSLLWFYFLFVHLYLSIDTIT